MDAWVWLLALAVLVVLGIIAGALSYAATRHKANYERARPYPPGAGPPRPTLVRAQALIHRGQKLQAVQIIRQETGLDLRKAREIAETINSGRPVSAGPPVDPAAPPSDLRVPGEAIARARLFVEQSGRIEAIEEIRRGSGIWTREARDFVDAWLDGAQHP